MFLTQEKISIKWDYDMVNSFVSNTGCKLVSTEYKNIKQKLTIKCVNCGDEYYQSFECFILAKYKMCKKCSLKNKEHKYNIEKIKQIAIDSQCILISTEYIDVKQKLYFYCKCGNLFNTNIAEFIHGNKRQCNMCGIKNASNKKRMNIKEVKKKTEEISDCILLSNEYISAHKKLRFMCSCGREFDRSWANFTNNNKRRCRTCSRKESNLELYVRKFLENNNISFVPQYTYNDCIYKGLLPFDFFLPDFNCCIEVDGQHHYEPIEHFGGISFFEKQKIRDKIKDDYCNNNKIKLIRIPYFQIKMSSEIISKEIFS